VTELYYTDPWLTVYAGDCRVVMAEMPEQSVHCVVTSPPYWGLRDYGTEGQIGLEPTPEAYVETMVAVFREVRRVLRDDGTVWLNLGDSYATQGGRGEARMAELGRPTPGALTPAAARGNASGCKTGDGLKPKDLVGIPWRVAFALQADGWYLRSDVVWSKPNPMPESVTDRPTKSHEYVFLLSKRERYYFDADAVRGPAGDERVALGRRPISDRQAFMQQAGMHGKSDSLRDYSRTERNIRTVWTIATQPYPGAHFATFPEALVEPCVKAGTSERGVCPDCGAPWVRVVERSTVIAERQRNVGGRADGFTRMPGGEAEWLQAAAPVTTGWRASCRHDAESVPATVLDPFAGSGTTGRVAQRLGRRAVLIDLNPSYLLQTMRRNRDIPLGLGVA
jgi:DNA modification methylase